ncbi:Kinesin-like protein unc-104 [Diplonema papillatum]|nr:Kinesin-like protein unc-104 [Diplonema papillatum]
MLIDKKEENDERVLVHVRVRPLTTPEAGHSVVVTSTERRKLSISRDGKGTNARHFGFDRVYWSLHGGSHFDTQRDIYDDIGKRMLNHAFAGFNTCIFAYGQTGSGKTYTMMGDHHSHNEVDRGIVPRACAELFERIERNYTAESNDAAAPGAAASDINSYEVFSSYYEIYNEKVFDLLEPNTEGLRVREHPTQGPYVENLTVKQVCLYEDVQANLVLGNKHRHTNSTKLNERSSRSHAVFTLTLKQSLFRDGELNEYVSRINLVDLAGSERTKNAGTTGETLTEGININKSLCTLGQVIHSLAESHERQKDTYVNFRDSNLTWLLRENLGGNSKTIMVAAISPASSCVDETLNTLRYADRVKQIRQCAVVNEDSQTKLIRDLRQEVAHLRRENMEISRLRHELAALQQRQAAPAEEPQGGGGGGGGAVTTGVAPYLVVLQPNPPPQQLLVVPLRAGGVLLTSKTDRSPPADAVAACLAALPRCVREAIARSGGLPKDTISVQLPGVPKAACLLLLKRSKSSVFGARAFEVIPLASPCRISAPSDTAGADDDAEDTPSSPPPDASALVAVAPHAEQAFLNHSAILSVGLPFSSSVVLRYTDPCAAEYTADPLLARLAHCKPSHAGSGSPHLSPDRLQPLGGGDDAIPPSVLLYRQHVVLGSLSKAGKIAFFSMSPAQQEYLLTKAYPVENAEATCERDWRERIDLARIAEEGLPSPRAGAAWLDERCGEDGPGSAFRRSHRETDGGGLPAAAGAAAPLREQLDAFSAEAAEADGRLGASAREEEAPAAAAAAFAALLPEEIRAHYLELTPAQAALFLSRHVPDNFHTLPPDQQRDIVASKAPLVPGASSVSLTLREQQEAVELLSPEARQQFEGLTVGQQREFLAQQLTPSERGSLPAGDRRSAADAQAAAVARLRELPLGCRLTAQQQQAVVDRLPEDAVRDFNGLSAHAQQAFFERQPPPEVTGHTPGADQRKLIHKQASQLRMARKLSLTEPALTHRDHAGIVANLPDAAQKRFHALTAARQDFFLAQQVPLDRYATLARGEKRRVVDEQQEQLAAVLQQQQQQQQGGRAAGAPAELAGRMLTLSQRAEVVGGLSEAAAGVFHTLAPWQQRLFFEGKPGPDSEERLAAVARAIPALTTQQQQRAIAALPAAERAEFHGLAASQQQYFMAKAWGALDDDFEHTSEADRRSARDAAKKLLAHAKLRPKDPPLTLQEQAAVVGEMPSSAQTRFHGLPAESQRKFLARQTAGLGAVLPDEGKAALAARRARLLSALEADCVDRDPAAHARLVREVVAGMEVGLEAQLSQRDVQSLEALSARQLRAVHALPVSQRTQFLALIISMQSHVMPRLVSIIRENHLLFPCADCVDRDPVAHVRLVREVAAGMEAGLEAQLSQRDVQSLEALSARQLRAVHALPQQAFLDDLPASDSEGDEPQQKPPLTQRQQQLLLAGERNILFSGFSGGSFHHEIGAPAAAPLVPPGFQDQLDTVRALLSRVDRDPALTPRQVLAAETLRSLVDKAAEHMGTLYKASVAPRDPFSPDRSLRLLLGAGCDSAAFRVSQQRCDDLLDALASPTTQPLVEDLRLAVQRLHRDLASALDALVVDEEADGNTPEPASLSDPLPAGLEAQAQSLAAVLSRANPAAGAELVAVLQSMAREAEAARAQQEAQLLRESDEALSQLRGEGAALQEQVEAIRHEVAVKDASIASARAEIYKEREVYEAKLREMAQSQKTRMEEALVAQADRLASAESCIDVLEIQYSDAVALHAQEAKERSEQVAELASKLAATETVLSDERADTDTMLVKFRTVKIERDETEKMLEASEQGRKRLQQTFEDVMSELMQERTTKESVKADCERALRSEQEATKRMESLRRDFEDRIRGLEKSKDALLAVKENERAKARTVERQHVATKKELLAREAELRHVRDISDTREVEKRAIMAQCDMLRSRVQGTLEDLERMQTEIVDVEADLREKERLVSELHGEKARALAAHAQETAAQRRQREAALAAQQAELNDLRQQMAGIEAKARELQEKNRDLYDAREKVRDRRQQLEDKLLKTELELKTVKTKYIDAHSRYQSVVKKGQKEVKAYEHMRKLTNLAKEQETRIDFLQNELKDAQAQAKRLEAHKASSLSVEDVQKARDDIQFILRLLKAEVIFFTPPALRQIQTIVNSIQHAIDPRRVFRQAFNHVRLIVTEISGKDQQHGGVWEVDEGQLGRMKAFQRASVLKALREIVVWHGVSPDYTRQEITAYTELVANHRFLLSLARFTQSPSMPDLTAPQGTGELSDAGLRSLVAAGRRGKKDYHTSASNHRSQSATTQRLAATYTVSPFDDIPFLGSSLVSSTAAAPRARAGERPSDRDWGTREAREVVPCPADGDGRRQSAQPCAAQAVVSVPSWQQGDSPGLPPPAACAPGSKRELSKEPRRESRSRSPSLPTCGRHFASASPPPHRPLAHHSSFTQLSSTMPSASFPATFFLLPSAADDYDIDRRLAATVDPKKKSFMQNTVSSQKKKVQREGFPLAANLLRKPIMQARSSSRPH